MKYKEVILYPGYNALSTTIAEDDSLLPWTYKELNVFSDDVTNFEGTSFSEYIKMFLTSHSNIELNSSEEDYYIGTYQGDCSKKYGNRVTEWKSLETPFTPSVVYIYGGGNFAILYPSLGLGHSCPYIEASSGAEFDISNSYASYCALLEVSIIDGGFKFRYNNSSTYMVFGAAMRGINTGYTYIAMR